VSACSFTSPPWCGTIERITFRRLIPSGCLNENRARSRWDFSPRSPCRARSKKAARLGTRGTSSSRISVVGLSMRLTCSIGYRLSCDLRFARRARSRPDVAPLMPFQYALFRAFAADAASGTSQASS